MQAGFGLGRLHHLIGSQQRQEVVLGAIDAGFTHFDLAPAYGDGLLERAFAKAIGNRREGITIATKFGIPFRPIGELPTPIYFAVRAAGKLLKTSFGAQYDRRDFTPKAATASLEQSLRRLRTDRIDLLLVHEPQNLEQFRTLGDTWSELERQQRLGKVRKLGISSLAELLLDAERHNLIPASAVRMIPMCDATCAQPEEWFRTREVLVFNIVKHLSKQLGPGRINTHTLIQTFASTLPLARPIFATHNLAEIKAMGEALALIAANPALRGVIR